MIIIIDCNKFQSHSNPGIQGLFEAENVPATLDLAVCFPTICP